MVFKEVRVKARGTKTLIAHAYSLACPKAKLHSN